MEMPVRLITSSKLWTFLGNISTSRMNSVFKDWDLLVISLAKLILGQEFMVSSERYRQMQILLPVSLPLYRIWIFPKR